MKQLKVNFIFCFLLLGCQVNKIEKTSPSVKIETFGDSLRVETEVRGSLTIKRNIDLKGTTDDGFDSSFDVMLKYEERLNKTINDPTYTFVLKGFIFSFFKEDVLNFCESRVKRVNKQKVNKNRNTRKEWGFVQKFKNFKDIVDGKVSLNTIHKGEQQYWMIELITHCNFSFIEEKTKQRPKSILIEHYETSFSGGRNLSVITSQNDTTAFLNHNDWMR